MVSYDDIQNGTADKNLKNRTGLAIQTIRTAIVQLENLGFINRPKQGGLKSGGFGNDTAQGMDKNLLLTYLHTAGRKNEILQLRWADVHFASLEVSLYTRKIS